jgi:hypothetical protein
MVNMRENKYMTNENKITITPKKMIEMGVVPMGVDTERVVFATSRDYKYITDLDKLLWQRREDFPFGDVYIDYSPATTPGIIGLHYLNVINPSPELVRLIEPSPGGPTYYEHLKDKVPEDINILINEMRKQGKNVKQIAQELNVLDMDIIVWSYFIEIKETFRKEVEKEAEELRKKLM